MLAERLHLEWLHLETYLGHFVSQKRRLQGLSGLEAYVTGGQTSRQIAVDMTELPA
jgi:hypothetical protein